MDCFNFLWFGVNEPPATLTDSLNILDFRYFVITELYKDTRDECMEISIDYMLHDGCLNSQSASSIMARHGEYGI